MQPTHTQLNAGQQAVVRFQDGQALVVAVAGSGKTRTIIERVARLIDEGTTPSAIWVTTFTNKAAREINHRVQSRCGSSADALVVGTVHSLCLRVYQRFHLGGETTILDQDDAEQCIKGCAVECLAQGEEFIKRIKPRDIYSLLSLEINTGKPLETLLENHRTASEQDLENLLAIKQSYLEYKQVHHMVDFDDILLNLLAAMNADRELARKISATCKYLIVDEFQDTNKLQLRIIRAFSHVHKNLMCVGDDAQSIYAFRGANPQQLQEFVAQIPSLQIFKLEENYRSTQGILEVGNLVLNQMDTPAALRKQLISAHHKHDLSGVTLQRVPSDFAQTDAVLAHVQQHLAQKKPANELCILVKYGFQALSIEAQLLAKKIPYIKYGGLKFLEKAHIKDVLCFLRFAVNKNDSLAFIRCLMLIDGIGIKKAREVQSAVASGQDDFLPLLPKKSQTCPLAQLLASYHGFFAQDSTTTAPETLVKDVLERYLPLLEKRLEQEPKTYADKARDLKEVLAIARSYIGVKSFVNDVVLGESALDNQDPSNSILISTIHSIKGLEREIVLIPNFITGVYPRDTDDPAVLEEEKRLGYVAITRAKKKLILIEPQTTRDKPKGTVPSPFLYPVPSHVNIKRL